jgi:hypothetical protein
MRTGHVEVRENDRHCGHLGCTQKFKSKKQKISHHDKLEADCAREKLLLTNLVGQFQKTLNDILANNNFCVNWVKETNEYKDLQQNLTMCSDSVMNREYFDLCVLNNLDK